MSQDILVAALHFQSKSYWSESDSPVSIMREQAKLLGDKTNNLVKADVGDGSPNNGRFVYHFYIVAPTLNNYHFRP